MDEVASRNLKRQEYGLNATTSLFNSNQQARTAMADAYLGAQASTQNAQTAANAPSAEVKTLQAFANNPALAEQYKNSPQAQAQLRSDIVSAMTNAQKTLSDMTASDEDRAEARAKMAGYQKQLQTMFNQNAPIPTGLPPGSKFVGTSGGKRVYQKPDGTQVVES
jgi:hypothetical protein